MNVHNVVLQRDLDKEIYMCLPKGFDKRGDKNLVCKLRKSLYSLKLSSRQWNVKLCDALIRACYSPSKLDYSLFTKHDGNQLVVLLVYVDDLLIYGNSAKLKMLQKCNFFAKYN